MYGKMQEAGLSEILPLIGTSAIGGQYLCFHIWLLDGRHSFFFFFLVFRATPAVAYGSSQARGQIIAVAPGQI